MGELEEGRVGGVREVGEQGGPQCRVCQMGVWIQQSSQGVT